MSNIYNIMTNNTVLLPRIAKTLTILGENIKIARLRRKISMEQIAQRAGISRATVGKVEQGSPSVSIGTYIQILFVLGLEKDFLLVAADDELGRKLQDAELLTKKRAPKSK
ncbi:MAG: helix-turn-helix transcriptional regulator [Spirochaetia bacterium]|jgi:transcriptional regulator with XRE-family HTH domain|nr:helix-turn-helix transcriptional regulator [Spirochaetia bacterium]